jgi:hypothetical protein
MENLYVCDHCKGEVKTPPDLAVFPNNTDLIDSLYACPPSDSDDDSFEFGSVAAKGGLLLDSYKNISNNEEENEKSKVEYCPNSFTYADILIQRDLIEQFKRVRVRCKSWECPYCKKINQFVLKKQLYYAFNAISPETVKDGFRPEYFYKFLTLTVPGTDYRGEKDILQAEIDLKENFNRLRTALKKKVGDFEYFWVCEKQRDGFPHLHVVLIGASIAHKGLLDQIRSLWVDRYGMGFVKINVVCGGLKSICSYISKYATKDMSSGKFKKNYCMSKRMASLMKEARIKEGVNFTVLEYGRIERNPDGSENFIPLWKLGDNALPDIFKEEIKETVNELVKRDQGFSQINLK